MKGEPRGRRTGEPRESLEQAERCRKLRLWLAWGPGRGKSSPNFILGRVWQLLVTVLCTKNGGGRLIQISKTLFALLKVINHSGHKGIEPRVPRPCVCA